MLWQAWLQTNKLKSGSPPSPGILPASLQSMTNLCAWIEEHYPWSRGRSAPVIRRLCAAVPDVASPTSAPTKRHVHSAARAAFQDAPPAKFGRAAPAASSAADPQSAPAGFRWRPRLATPPVTRHDSPSDKTPSAVGVPLPNATATSTLTAIDLTEVPLHRSHSCPGMCPDRLELLNDRHVEGEETVRNNLPRLRCSCSHRTGLTYVVRRTLESQGWQIVRGRVIVAGAERSAACSGGAEATGACSDQGGF